MDATAAGASATCDVEHAPIARRGVGLLPMIAAIPDYLQHEVLVPRCVVQPVPSALLSHLGRPPASSVCVQHEGGAARSDVERDLLHEGHAPRSGLEQVLLQPEDQFALPDVDHVPSDPLFHPRE